MFAKDGKGCIGFEIVLFRVEFVGRCVRGRKLLKVMIVVDMHLGRMVVVFDVVVVECVVSFAGRHL